MTRRARWTWIESIAALIVLAALVAVAVPAYNAWLADREAEACRKNRDEALANFLAYRALFGNETTTFSEYAQPAYGGADTLCPEGGTVTCIERNGGVSARCSLHEPADRVILGKYTAKNIETFRRAAADVYALSFETVERVKAEHPGIAAGQYINISRAGATVVLDQGVPFDWSAALRAGIDDHEHTLTEGMVVLRADPALGITVSHVFLRQGNVWVKYAPQGTEDSTMGLERDTLTAPAAG